MNPRETSIDWVPGVILLLGTDASGKNHVANLWARKLKALGCDLVIREGGLCGKPAKQGDHGDKSQVALWAERGFIFLFPLARWTLPPALTLLLHWDAWRFKPPKQKMLAVSHNVLRILAFYLGQSRRHARDKTLPTWMERAIRRVHRASKAMVIVLDVDDATRQRRIQARLHEGSVDPFDRFMAADSARSERIEACLVRLATHYCQAYLVENNDLSDDALWEAFQKACLVHQQRIGHEPNA